VISRVAESCFWIFRHVERVDTTARLLRVHAGMVLDSAVPSSRTWQSLLIVLGEEARFLEEAGAEGMADGEKVQAHLTWSPTNPASILSGMRMAREGARTIRETVSLEMWDALNQAWIWLANGRGRRVYRRERTTFYEEVGHRCHRFHGACMQSMLHEEPFDFMRLGLNLERAGQTARILDLRHHALGPQTGAAESTADAAEWIAILRSCAAYEPFFKKRTAPLAGPAVAEFLLLEPAFPGSVLHSLTRAENFLRRIRQGAGGRGQQSASLLDDLLQELRRVRLDQVAEEGFHPWLTRLVDRTGEVCLAIRDDYFTGALPPAQVDLPSPLTPES